MTTKDLDRELADALGRDDFTRIWLQRTDESLQRDIQRIDPTIVSESLDELLIYMRETQANDPFALLQPLMPGPGQGQILNYREMNLELALFIAQLTGAAVYADSRMYWNQMLMHASAGGEDEKAPPWAPLLDTLAGLTVTTELNSYITHELRDSYRQGRFRRMMRRIGNTIASGECPDVQHLVHLLKLSAQRTESEWNSCATTTE
jgi:hypothetical protein